MDIAMGHKTVCVLASSGEVTCRRMAHWRKKADTESLSPLKSLAPGGYCGLDNKGRARCAPRAVKDGIPAERFSTLSATSGHACGIAMDGRVLCWGSADYSHATDALPGKYVALDTASRGTCALDEEGRVACWGKVPHPDERARAARFTTVSVGGARACGVTKDKTLLCWPGHPKL